MVRRVALGPTGLLHALAMAAVPIHIVDTAPTEPYPLTSKASVSRATVRTVGARILKQTAIVDIIEEGLSTHAVLPPKCQRVAVQQVAVYLWLNPSGVSLCLRVSQN